MYPEESRRIIKNVCKDAHETTVTLVTSETPPTELPIGERLSGYLTRSYANSSEKADEIPVISAVRIEDDTGFNVSDPIERGLRARTRKEGGFSSNKRKTQKRKYKNTRKYIKSNSKKPKGAKSNGEKSKSKKIRNYNYVT